MGDRCWNSSRAGVLPPSARRDEIAAAVRAERAKAAANRAELVKKNPSKDDDDLAEVIAAFQQANPDVRTPAEIKRDKYEWLFYDTLKQIHIDWLMTPRDDLDGNRPREAVLLQHDHISWDLQDQSQNWSAINRQPPAISVACQAYRYAGFGTPRNRALLRSGSRIAVVMLETNAAVHGNSGPPGLFADVRSRRLPGDGSSAIGNSLPVVARYTGRRCPHENAALRDPSRTQSSARDCERARCDGRPGLPLLPDDGGYARPMFLASGRLQYG